MKSQNKTSSDYLNDLLNTLTNSTVISDKFINYILQIANKSIADNFESGKNNDDEIFDHYKKLVKEFHYITIFSTHFQNLVLGIIHDCITTAYEEGQKERAN
jgi:hypothetical protein